MLAPQAPIPHTELVYDRREYQRVKLEAPAIVDAFHTWQKCTLRSVSTRGFSLASDLRLPLGTRVEVYFELPTTLAVETQAELVRISQGDLGFRFVELGNVLHDSLEAYVAMVLAESSPEDELLTGIC